MAEKLSETVGVKLSESVLKQVRGVADAVGTTDSAWIRSLIEAALREKEREYRALHSIFGQVDPETKDNSE